MSILHLVRTSAYQQDDLAQCLDVYSSEDTIVLMDDGCYNLEHTLLKKRENIQVLVITEHCLARAIAITNKNQAIALEKLTTLFFSYDSVLTWQ